MFFLDISSVSVYALAGAVTGFTAGVFGIGGGMLMVPVLLYLFGRMQTIPHAMLMQVAAATSLAIMLFTALAAVWAHLKQGTIPWDRYRRLWPGIVMGTMLGALLAPMLETQLLKKILGFMLLCALINIVYKIRQVPIIKTPRRYVEYIVGFFIGGASGLVGIGGGVLVIPYMTFCGTDARKTSAISSACTIAVALVGTVVYVFIGLKTRGLPPHCIGYVYWPAAIWMTIPSMLMAPLGARLTYILPLEQLKYAFALLLMVIITKLLI